MDKASGVLLPHPLQGAAAKQPTKPILGGLCPASMVGPITSECSIGPKDGHDSHRDQHPSVCDARPKAPKPLCIHTQEPPHPAHRSFLSLSYQGKPHLVLDGHGVPWMCQVGRAELLSAAVRLHGDPTTLSAAMWAEEPLQSKAPTPRNSTGPGGPIPMESIGLFFFFFGYTRRNHRDINVAASLRALMKINPFNSLQMPFL